MNVNVNISSKFIEYIEKLFLTRVCIHSKYTGQNLNINF